MKKRPEPGPREPGELEQVQKPKIKHNNNYTRRGTNC